MALDFTTIKDRDGAALYIIHNRSYLEEQRATEIKAAVEALATEHQVILIPSDDPNGESIRSFYGILPEQIPVAMIVRDDDSLAAMWSANEIPVADVIAYELKQTSEQ